MKPKSSLWKITQYMHREAKIKAMLRVVSRRKAIIDSLIAFFAVLSIILNFSEVRKHPLSSKLSLVLCLHLIDSQWSERWTQLHFCGGP